MNVRRSIICCSHSARVRVQRESVRASFPSSVAQRRRGMNRLVWCGLGANGGLSVIQKGPCTEKLAPTIMTPTEATVFITAWEAMRVGGGWTNDD